MKRLALVASSLIVLAGPALAEGCRIPDPKPGQPLQVPSACRDAVRSKQQNVETRKGEPGTVDLGNGTTVRIGGRVRVETGWRR